MTDDIYLRPEAGGVDIRPARGQHIGMFRRSRTFDRVSDDLQISIHAAGTRYIRYRHRVCSI